MKSRNVTFVSGFAAGILTHKYFFIPSIKWFGLLFLLSIPILYGLFVYYKLNDDGNNEWDF